MEKPICVCFWDSVNAVNCVKRTGIAETETPRVFREDFQFLALFDGNVIETKRGGFGRCGVAVQS